MMVSSRSKNSSYKMMKNRFTCILMLLLLSINVYAIPAKYTTINTWQVRKAKLLAGETIPEAPINNAFDWIIGSEPPSPGKLSHIGKLMFTRDEV